MKKSELIAEFAQDNPHLTPADAEKIVSTIFGCITAALAQGQRVELRGFGHFTVRQRQARDGRNPRTGEPVSVDGKKVPFFKVGKELRQRVDQHRPQPSRGAKAAARRMSRNTSQSFYLTRKASLD